MPDNISVAEASASEALFAQYAERGTQYEYENVYEYDREGIFMPDLVTHLCAAQITGRLRRIELFSVFALGAVLPDLLSRPFHILIPGTFWYVAPMHSPVVCLLYCALISLLFCRETRKAVFFCLLGGVALHLALDSLQNQFRPYYFWLFPFSWRSWWAGLFWPDQALKFLPVTVAVTVLISVVIKKKKSLD